MHWIQLWNLLYSSSLAWRSLSSIWYLLPLSCHWIWSWFLKQSLPNPGFQFLCLTYQAFFVHKCLLHLLWGKLGLPWFYCWSLWPCYSWETVLSLSTSLQILFGDYQTILGLVPYSLAFLPICSCSLLLLVLVLMTSLYLFVCLCLRLLLWFARILVILTMSQYRLSFWNLSWFLFVVYTICISFLTGNSI